MSNKKLGRNRNENTYKYNTVDDKSTLLNINFVDKRIHSSLYNSIFKEDYLDLPALAFRNREIKYLELYHNIDLFATRLYNLGVRENDKVVIVMPNIPQTVYLIYALNKIGAVSLILHPKTTQAELEKNINIVKPTFFFTVDVFFNKYEKVSKKINTKLIRICDDFYGIEKIVLINSTRKKRKNIDEDLFLDKVSNRVCKFKVNNNPFKLSFLLGSGGTTGESKIIELNDYSLNIIAAYCPYILRKKPNDFYNTSMIGLLPFFHGYGLTMGLHAALFNGAYSYLFVNFSTKDIIKQIKKNRLNYMISVPYIIRNLLEDKKFRTKKLKYLTHVFVGGSKTELNLLTEFDAIMKKYNSRCQLFEGYGLTETVCVNVVSRSNEKKNLSVGKPLPLCRIKIFDFETKSLSDKQKVTGEICINSESLMLKYFNETQENMNKYYIYDEYNNKYLKTGDYGYFDDDGFLYIVGRLKNIYKISGFNIFPEEIIKVATTFKEVRCGATKLYEKNSKKFIYLFLEIHKLDMRENLLQEIKDKIKTELNSYYQPYKIVVRENLDKTPLGKVDLTRLEINDYEL